MPKYAWIITEDRCYTEDFDEPEDNAVGVTGPRGITDAMVARLQSGEGITFYCGDEEVATAVKGRILGNFFGFEPLDDFCQPNWGCTEIRYPGSTLYGNGAAL